MPSLTDLPIDELKKDGAALQVITDQLGTIKDNKAEGNCGYYAVGIGLKELKNDLAGKTIPKYATSQNKIAAKTMRKNLVECEKAYAKHIIHNDKNTFPIFILFRDNGLGHSHLYNFHNCQTEEEREEVFIDFAGNSIYMDAFDDTNDGGIGDKFYLEANRTLPSIMLIISLLPIFIIMMAAYVFGVVGDY